MFAVNQCLYTKLGLVIHWCQYLAGYLAYRFTWRTWDSCQEALVILNGGQKQT